MLSIEIVLVIVFLTKRILNWNSKARDLRKLYKSTFVVPQYKPPENGFIHVAEGEQVSIKRTKSSYVATLLELAVKKSVDIVKVQGEKEQKDPAWNIHVNVGRDELTYSQVLMLRILNGGETITKGTDITIKKHKPTSQLAEDARLYKDSAQAVLERGGYMVNNNTATVFYAGSKRINNDSAEGIVAAFFFKFIMAIFLIAFVYAITWKHINVEDYIEVVGGDYLPIVLLSILIIWILVGTIIGGKTQKYQKYTPKGILLARYLEGLELYIKMAEKDRLVFLQSVEGVDTSTEGIVRLYEKLLHWESLLGKVKKLEKGKI